MTGGKAKRAPVAKDCDSRGTLRFAPATLKQISREASTCQLLSAAGSKTGLGPEPDRPEAPRELTSHVAVRTVNRQPSAEPPSCRRLLRE